VENITSLENEGGARIENDTSREGERNQEVVIRWGGNEKKARYDTGKGSKNHEFNGNCARVELEFQQGGSFAPRGLKRGGGPSTGGEDSVQWQATNVKKTSPLIIRQNQQGAGGMGA